MNTLINILTNPMTLVYWVIYTTLGMWFLFAGIHILHEWVVDKGETANAVMDWVDKVFWLIDVLFNLLVGSIWFLELPKGDHYRLIETFSDRLRWHYHCTEKGWRHALAALFRGPINVVDKGHI